MKPLKVQHAVDLANWAAEAFGLDEGQRGLLFGKAHTMLWAFETDAKNQGSEGAARALLKVANTGEHSGRFGGETMEKAAKSIMELWEPDCDERCKCLACECGGTYKPTGLVRTCAPPIYDYKCDGCGKNRSMTGGRKR